MSEIVRAGAVVLQGGEPRVSSLKVAEVFGKKHYNVLRAIDQLRIDAADMMRDGDVTAARFHALNFEATLQAVPGPNGAVRSERAFSITEGAFMVLTMGFTGREALRLKILFIEEFKRMREELQAQNHARWPRAAADRLLEPGNGNPEWPLFLSAWWSALGDRRVSGAELRAMVEAGGLLPSLLDRCLTERGRATALGRALNAHSRRESGPFQVRRLPLSRGYPTYRLLRTELQKALGP